MQLTVHVTLICCCVGLGKTTQDVTLKAAGAAQQKTNIQTNIQTNKTTQIEMWIIEVPPKYTMHLLEV